MQFADERRLSSPAALRNRQPILEALAPRLPAIGTVLEVASGSGEHAVFFARHLPDLVWQPSEPTAEGRDSIAAYRDEAHLPNLAAPIDLDVTQQPWPVDALAAVLAINLCHIAPWAVTEALLTGAGSSLAPKGQLFLYGPFFEDGLAPAESNLAFDRALRSHDPAWGLRRLEAVAGAAAAAGFDLTERLAMPANNLLLHFRRRSL